MIIICKVCRRAWGTECYAAHGPGTHLDHEEAVCYKLGYERLLDRLGLTSEVISALINQSTEAREILGHGGQWPQDMSEEDRRKVMIWTKVCDLGETL